MAGPMGRSLPRSLPVVLLSLLLLLLFSPAALTLSTVDSEQPGSGSPGTRTIAVGASTRAVDEVSSAAQAWESLGAGVSRGLAEMLSLALGSGGGGTQVVALCLFVFLLSTCMVVGHLLEEVKWLNESVTAIGFGLVSGAVVLLVTRQKSSHILRFDEDLFFIYLLPPIIFNAGFQVKKKQFFRNFGAIMMYGVVGVFMSVAVIATGCSLLFPLLGLPGETLQVYLVLGVIFSATDSVCTLQVLDQDEQPLLYSLVFGEGVVNDATSVVLFYAMNHLPPGTDTLGAMKILEILLDFLYLFVSSTALGVALGLLSAFLIKTLYFGRHSTDREIALMALMAYQSYVIAELLQLSGILAVFFCGIVMSHYTWHNVTESSRVTTKHSFATMSYIAETFIFIYVGMDALDRDKWKDINLRAVGGMFAIFLALILVGRAAFMFPLTMLMNRYRKSRRTISFRHMVVIWWSGLMRGAVSIALIYRASAEFESGPSRDVESATTATMAVVLFSTLVFGTLTRPIIDLLVPHNVLDRSTSLLTDRGSTPNHSAPNHDTPFSAGKPAPESGAGAPSENHRGVNGEEKGVPGLADASLFKEGVLEIVPGGAAESAAAGAGPGDPSSQASGAPGTSGQALGVESDYAGSRHLVNILTSGRERDLHDWWRWFDDSYMRPYFGGRGFMPVLPPSPTVSVQAELTDGAMSIRRLNMRTGPFASTLEAADDEYSALHGNEEEARAQGASSVRKVEVDGDAVEGRHLCDEPAWPVAYHHHEQRCNDE